jgi:hypothetical protein
MPARDDLLNKGLIVKPAEPAGNRPGRAGRTIIVTGLHRSGTSLVASILRQAGLFIGTEINDVVYEDEEIARILASRDAAALKRIIGERDHEYRSWGFKQPMLCRDLDAAQLALFNDPSVIVTFRDPVSMSVRTSLSEYQQPMQALCEAMSDLNAMMAFIAELRCPVLLLSYEKALTFPHDFVDAIIQFCGIPRNAALRARLIGVIEPNRPSYIIGARKRFEGTIDGVREGRLHGWCRLSHSIKPVALHVLVDERKVLSLLADNFRQDLLQAGIGRGNHGFSIALQALRAQPDAMIRIKVADIGVELDNSGKRLWEFGSADAPPA